MKISFQLSDDKNSSKIFLDGLLLGSVELNIWSQKWHMAPNFNLPYNFTDVKKNKFESSYEAGKEMVGLYNFLFPKYDEEIQEFGIGLDDMLSFLKARE
jgi:hypothetical protein